MNAGLTHARTRWLTLTAAAVFAWLVSCAAEKQPDNEEALPGAQAAAAQAENATSASPDSSIVSDAAKTVVYYFHTSMRCRTCHLLETYAKQAVDSVFADELQAGTVVFTPLNVEEDRNKHFMQDYKLHTKSVVVSVLGEDGAELRWKNLDQIWNLVRSEDKYKQYVVKEIRALREGAEG